MTQVLCFGACLYFLRVLGFAQGGAARRELRVLPLPASWSSGACRNREQHLNFRKPCMEPLIRAEKKICHFSTGACRRWPCGIFWTCRETRRTSQPTRHPPGEHNEIWTRKNLPSRHIGSAARHVTAKLWLRLTMLTDQSSRTALRRWVGMRPRRRATRTISGVAVMFGATSGRRHLIFSPEESAENGAQPAGLHPRPGTALIRIKSL